MNKSHGGVRAFDTRGSIPVPVPVVLSCGLCRAIAGPTPEDCFLQTRQLSAEQLAKRVGLESGSIADGWLSDHAR